MVIKILLLLFSLQLLHRLRVVAFFKYVDILNSFNRLRMGCLLFFVLRVQFRIIPLYPGGLDDYAVFISRQL